jgi:hypothetical protein
MSYEEVAAKFRGCAEFAGWDKRKTEAVVEAVRDLESLDSVRRLTQLLSA